MAKKVIYHTNQSVAQIAYLAGIIDGEGCLYIGRVRQGKYGCGWQWHVMLRVTSCDEVLILWLEQTFGGSKDSRYRWTSKKKFTRPVYNWQATGEMLDYVLSAVEPYLIIKKPQCDVIKRYRKTCKNIGNKRLPDHINEQRFELLKELKNLNSRWHEHPLKNPSALSSVS